MPLDIQRILQLIEDAKNRAGEFVNEISNLNKSMKKMIEGLDAIKELVSFLNRNEEVLRELLTEMKKMNDNFELIKEILSKMS